jgi:site-specific recombinase XerC
LVRGQKCSVVFVPVLARSVIGGRVTVSLGDTLLDEYVEFVGARASVNTMLATAFDLKVFFTIVTKAPSAVTTADVFEFLRVQRLPRRGGNVVRTDREQGLAARTIARRLSTVRGLFSYLIARDDVLVVRNPVPTGLAARRPSGRRSTRGVPLIRTPRTMPRVLSPIEADSLLAALRRDRDRAMFEAMLLGGLRRCEVLGLRSEGYALANRQLAFAAKARAVHGRDPVALARALSLLEVARLHDEQLTLTHMVDLGTDGAYLCEILGRDPSAWIDYAIAAAGRMEHQPSAPLAARLSTSRPRYELAGVAAANEADPSELAWTLHRVCQPLKADEGARHTFMRDLDELSRDLTMVFLAQSRLHCRAAVLRSGAWTAVDLPNLALDKIGHVVVAAHHAHSAAESGSIAARTQWSAARSGLNGALASALLPLVAVLAAEQRPVVLRLSGWGHAMPIAPLLMAQLGYSLAVVVSLGLPWAPAATPRPTALAALAAPGDGKRFRHLPLALDDAEHVARLFGTSAMADATKEGLARALRTASTVLVACHGASAEDCVPPRRRRCPDSCSTTGT